CGRPGGTRTSARTGTPRSEPRPGRTGPERRRGCLPMSPQRLRLLILAGLLAGCSDTTAAPVEAPPQPAARPAADAALEARILELEGQLREERAERLARE